VADEPQNLQKTNHGSVPSPDPTVLTTQNLQREILAVRELVELRIEAVSGLTESKYLVCMERFDRLEGQLRMWFQQMEAQRLEQKADTRQTVNAALDAQKELVRQETAASEQAISKSESNLTKQLEQLGITQQTEITSLRRNIDENKERIVSVDAKANAFAEQKAGAKESQAGLYAAIAAVGVIVTIGIAVITLVISGG
jgi:hypothetical protein